MIPFKKGCWLAGLLCSAYSLTTPLSFAIGLGGRKPTLFVSHCKKRSADLGRYYQYL